MSSSLKFDKHSLITMTIITMDNSASSPQKIPLYPIILSPSARPRQAVISPVPSVTETDSQSTEPLLPASRTWRKAWGASGGGRQPLLSSVPGVPAPPLLSPGLG